MRTRQNRAILIRAGPRVARPACGTALNPRHPAHPLFSAPVANNARADWRQRRYKKKALPRKIGGGLGWGL